MKRQTIRRVKQVQIVLTFLSECPDSPDQAKEALLAHSEVLQARNAELQQLKQQVCLIAAHIFACYNTFKLHWPDHTPHIGLNLFFSIVTEQRGGTAVTEGRGETFSK